MKVIWRDTIIAESPSTVVVEGKHYFPAESVRMEYLRKNGGTYQCPWKGLAYDYDIVIGNAVNKDAAWIYPEPKEAAREIKGHVAFEKNKVEIVA